MTEPTVERYHCDGCDRDFATFDELVDHPGCGDAEDDDEPDGGAGAPVLVTDGGESEAARLAADAVQDLERSTETIERAQGYARRAEFEHPINRTPKAVAAASVYLAAMMNGEKATQDAVSEAVGVNTQTLRDALAEIAEAEENLSVGTGSGTSHEEPADPVGMIDAVRGWFA